MLKNKVTVYYNRKPRRWQIIHIPGKWKAQQIKISRLNSSIVARVTRFYITQIPELNKQSEDTPFDGSLKICKYIWKMLSYLVLHIIL